MKKIAIYPGSFDPVTNGHVDIIERGIRLFDKVIVAVLHNSEKKGLFTVEERLDMLKECLSKFPKDKLEIDSFNGLLVDYAHKKRTHILLRGMRAVSDFEYEFQLALINRKLSRNIQTVFLMTSLKWLYISSSIVKEAAQYHGDVEGMVPHFVVKKLQEKFSNSKKK